jgi:hypothetical protein
LPILQGRGGFASHFNGRMIVNFSVQLPFHAQPEVWL